MLTSQHRGIQLLELRLVSTKSVKKVFFVSFINFFAFLTLKGPFPLRAWKRAFFVSFIDLRLKRTVKIEVSAKKKQ